MKVIFIFRDPKRGGTSVEEIFNDLYEDLINKVVIEKFHYNDRGGFWAQLRQLRSKNADLFHITSDIYWLAIFLPKKKCVLTIHDIGHYLGMRGLRKFVYRLIYFNWPGQNAAFITTVSEFTENSLRSVFPRAWFHRISTIYNPIPSIFSRKIVSPVPGEKIVLQIGTGSHKNLNTVIKALIDLPYKLHVIGALGPKEAELLAVTGVKYIHSENLNFDKIFEAYRKADAVTFVSSYEGFGMPIVEAQASGRPVITSKLASMPEIAGTGACFVDDPLNVQQVRAAIIQVMEDQKFREQLIQNGFENCKRFARDQIVKQYLELYRSLHAMQ